MFEATDVEDNFRVSNPVPGNGGGVRLASVVVCWHVLGSKQPTLDFSTNQVMIFNFDLCVVLEGGEKITPLCNPRNLRDAPFKPRPEKITHICFHDVLDFYLLTCEGHQPKHSSHFPHSPTVS